ncbi:MAG TPA: MBL fold metallo-hydrolase [Terracidiphilus sp.]|nr:MBL fold metallo-hydrolase [Terracidiphilus sp.]
MRNADSSSLSALARTRAPRHPFALAAILALLCALAFAAFPPPASAQHKNLRIYTIDVEGGQSTLIVAPSGHSMLVDTGWPDHNGRDTDRILAAMHDAGITRLDKVFITHYHDDHVGGVPNLVQRVHVGEFLDHGPNREDSADTRHNYAAYLQALKDKGISRRIVKPGDTVSIPGLSIVVLAADGAHIHAIPGIAPQPNPYCAKEPKWPYDPTENARSAGFLLRYGKFSFLDLGDLTKAKEIALVCPDDPIGHVDLYLVDHHGMNLSNSHALVDAIHPVVAIMDNGAHKAGMPEAWQTVQDSPSLKALYMLHYAEGSDAAHNSAVPLIANLKGSPDGAYFKVVADADGNFSVTNSRTGKTVRYPAK